MALLQAAALENVPVAVPRCDVSPRVQAVAEDFRHDPVSGTRTARDEEETEERR
jgi:hypothetical protein